MSQVIKIIKENKLNIPIGTYLHFTSFFDKVKNDNPKIWDSVGCYVWQSQDGKLNIINQHQIYPDLKDCYVNTICLSWDREFLYEGDEYWKVFTQEQKTIYHKLEFDGKNHYPALLLKPYRDIVQDNTNFFQSDYQRFKTKEQAEEYCYKVKNNIPFNF